MGVAACRPTDERRSNFRKRYCGVVFPDELPLARASVDRDALSRQDPELVSRLLTSDVSRVLIVDGARVATVENGAKPRLLLVPGDEFPAEFGASETVNSAYLGSDSQFSYVAIDAGGKSDELLARLDQQFSEIKIAWGSPRIIGANLTASETGLVTTALALMQWHRRNRHCPHCGSITVATESGWVRFCAADRSQHFPRTDPAVIMAITDSEDRILLGRGAAWPANRFSTLAGFIEPGETPENAVRREVYEESGIRVGEVEYRGSQPWPFPASLMLAYTGNALSTDITVDGVEMLDARWFSRTELAQVVADEEIILPGRASVARALIEHWFGQPIADRDEF